MTKSRLGAESARRVLRLLLAFQEHAHTWAVRDLARVVNMPLPSVHRYVALLRDEGLLVEAGAGKYRLSSRVFSLARAAEAAEPFIQIADPVMRRLSEATGETVLLVEIVNNAAVCVHRIESRQALRLTYEPGEALPLNRGASVKLLLAGLPPGERHKHLDGIADSQFPDFLRQIEQAGQQGWATSHGEIDTGIWAAAAAVMVQGNIAASLSVPCPLSRATASAQKEILTLAREAATEINTALQARALAPGNAT